MYRSQSPKGPRIGACEPHSGNPVSQALALLLPRVRSPKVTKAASMSDVESKILVRELGRLAGWLGGWGARWAARRLPSVAFETQFEVENSLVETSRQVEGLLNKIGRNIPEMKSDP